MAFGRPRGYSARRRRSSAPTQVFEQRRLIRASAEADAESDWVGVAVAQRRGPTSHRRGLG